MLRSVKNVCPGKEMQFPPETTRQFDWEEAQFFHLTVASETATSDALLSVSLLHYFPLLKDVLEMTSTRGEVLYLRVPSWILPTSSLLRWIISFYAYWDIADKDNRDFDLDAYRIKCKEDIELAILTGRVPLVGRFALTQEELFCACRFLDYVRCERELLPLLVPHAKTLLDQLMPLDYSVYWPPRPDAENENGLLVDPRYRWCEARSLLEREKLGPAFSQILSTASLGHTILPSRHLTPLGGGGVHAMVRSADGTLWGCGSNRDGALGLSQSQFPYDVREWTKLDLFDGEKVVAVHCRYRQSLVVLESGTLWGFGYNRDGQLGFFRDPDVHKRIIATPHFLIGTIRELVVAAACGQLVSCFITAKGVLWTCGSNRNKTRGARVGLDQYAPLPVLSNVVAVSCGSGNTVALEVDGSVWVSGKSIEAWRDENLLAQEKRTTTTVFVKLKVNALILLPSINSNIVFVSETNEVRGVRAVILTTRSTILSADADNRHYCLLCSDGSVRIGGFNTTGCIGDGSDDNVEVERMFYPAPNSFPEAIAATTLHSLIEEDFPKEQCGTMVLMSDGSLRVTGSNRHGQIGIGETTQVNQFTQSPLDTGYRSVNLANDDVVEIMRTEGLGKLRRRMLKLHL
jgi:alpha-tubulin suppressor-like RCC1 family protein